MSDEEYQVIRRTATRARLERRPRYACAQCGHAVYAPRDGRTGKPYFKHHPGTPEDYPWWTGIPSPERLWNEDFLERWRAATGEHGTEWPEREALLGELAEWLQLPAIDSQALGDADTDDLITCFLSLLEGRPIGSRQKNLVELLNTFLSVQRRYRFARVVKRFAELCDRRESLEAKSVRDKLIEASKATQDDPASMTGRIALGLFRRSLPAVRPGSPGPRKPEAFLIKEMA